MFKWNEWGKQLMNIYHVWQYVVPDWHKYIHIFWGITIHYVMLDISSAYISTGLSFKDKQLCRRKYVEITPSPIAWKHLLYCTWQTNKSECLVVPNRDQKVSLLQVNFQPVGMLWKGMGIDTLANEEPSLYLNFSLAVAVDCYVFSFYRQYKFEKNHW